MAMEKIEFSRAKIIAEKKGLKPGKVKGTEGIQFTKGNNNRLDVINTSIRLKGNTIQGYITINLNVRILHI